ncbi:MAG: type IV toxin-antitoxin system AbiEi family antitoxin [Aureibaculum sp.]|nr:type IV toxin-antitoxin system AbiEi family antitoxin [Aureibaculum sp.]
MKGFDKINEYLNKLDSELIIEKYDSYDIHNESELYDEIILINGERVYVEIKREIRPQHLPNLEHFLQFNEPLLLVAEYITPKSKEILKQNKINYLDSYGNGYINLKYLKVYIEKGGARPVYLQNYKTFTASGGQVLFCLLKYPEKINATYREIAKMSKVSLGTVSKTFKTLIEKEYVVKWSSDQKYQLVRKEELLHEWIIILNEKVLPSYRRGNFSFSKQLGSWKDIPIGPFANWGGEAGAALLSNYLSPEKLRLYTTLSNREIISEMRLIPNENGDIEIYEPFWSRESLLINANSNHYTKFGTIHPLIIYAELMYTEKDRNIETAKIIYNEFIGPNL